MRSWSKGLRILKLSLYKLGKVEGSCWGGVCGVDNWGRYPAELKSRASRDRLHPPAQPQQDSGPEEKSALGRRKKNPS